MSITHTVNVIRVDGCKRKINIRITYDKYVIHKKKLMIKYLNFMFIQFDNSGVLFYNKNIINFMR